jgi:hypothetical protein
MATCRFLENLTLACLVAPVTPVRKKPPRLRGGQGSPIKPLSRAGRQFSSFLIRVSTAQSHV